MDETYLIWSIEHNAWWKPESFGYTVNINKAGVYSEQESLEIIKGANLHITLTEKSFRSNELRIPLKDASLYGRTHE